MLNVRNKLWVKAIAWLIVMTFLPEQVAWAVDYNWRGVLNARVSPLAQAAAVAGDPSVLAGSPQASDKVVADEIKEVLTQLIGRRATDIRLPAGVSVHRNYPLSLTEEKVNELHAWMLDPSRNLVTCGALALTGLLKLMDIRLMPYQVAHYALLIDILSDSLDIYTYNKAKRLESSLYALAKTALLFGVELKPFHVNDFDLHNKVISKELNKLIPFIAFVDDDHMVLVKGLSKDSLIVEDNGKENILSRDEFQRRFSGYGLALARRIPKDLKIEYLDDEVAKAIRGTKRQVYDTYNFDDFFKGPSTGDLLLSLGIMLGTAAFGSVVHLPSLVPGSSAQGFSVSSFSASGMAQSFTTGLIISQISTAATSLSIRSFGFNPTQASIFGAAVGGAAASLTGPGVSFKPDSFFAKLAKQYLGTTGTSVLAGMIKATAAEGAQLLAYKYLKHNDDIFSKIFIPTLASAGGYLVGQGIVNGLGVNSVYSINQKDIGPKGVTINPQNGLGLFDGNTITMALSSQIGLGDNAGFLDKIFAKLGLLGAFNDTNFRTRFISDLIGNGFEQAANKWFGSNSPYSRSLGSAVGSVAAGFMLGSDTPGDSIKKSILAGASSVLLNALGGSYKADKDGVLRNKWGMTSMQMAAITYFGTSFAIAGYEKISGGSDIYNQNSFWGVLINGAKGDKGQPIGGLRNLGVSLSSFGETAPAYFAKMNQPYDSYSEYQYFSQLFQMSGISDLNANVDYMIKQSNKNNGPYKTWDDIVHNGGLSSLSRPLDNWIVSYVSSSLHYAAAENLGFLMSSVSYRDYRNFNKKNITDTNPLLIDNRALDGLLASNPELKGKLTEDQLKQALKDGAVSVLDVDKIHQVVTIQIKDGVNTPTYELSLPSYSKGQRIIGTADQFKKDFDPSAYTKIQMSAGSYTQDVGKHGGVIGWLVRNAFGGDKNPVASAVFAKVDNAHRLFMLEKFGVKTSAVSNDVGIAPEIHTLETYVSAEKAKILFNAAANVNGTADFSHLTAGDFQAMPYFLAAGLVRGTNKNVTVINGKGKIENGVMGVVASQGSLQFIINIPKEKPLNIVSEPAGAEKTVLPSPVLAWAKVERNKASGIIPFVLAINPSSSSYTAMAGGLVSLLPAQEIANLLKSSNSNLANFTSFTLPVADKGKGFSLVNYTTINAANAEKPQDAYSWQGTLNGLSFDAAKPAIPLATAVEKKRAVVSLTHQDMKELVIPSMTKLPKNGFITTTDYENFDYKYEDKGLSKEGLVQTIHREMIAEQPTPLSLSREFVVNPVDHDLIYKYEIAVSNGANTKQKTELIEPLNALQPIGKFVNGQPVFENYTKKVNGVKTSTQEVHPNGFVRQTYFDDPSSPEISILLDPKSGQVYQYRLVGKKGEDINYRSANPPTPLQSSAIGSMDTNGRIHLDGSYIVSVDGVDSFKNEVLSNGLINRVQQTYFDNKGRETATIIIDPNSKQIYSYRTVGQYGETIASLVYRNTNNNPLIGSSIARMDSNGQIILNGSYILSVNGKDSAIQQVLSEGRVLEKDLVKNTETVLDPIKKLVYSMTINDKGKKSVVTFSDHQFDATGKLLSYDATINGKKETYKKIGDDHFLPKAIADFVEEHYSEPAQLEQVVRKIINEDIVLIGQGKNQKLLTRVDKTATLYQDGAGHKYQRIGDQFMSPGSIIAAALGPISVDLAAQNKKIRDALENADVREPLPRFVSELKKAGLVQSGLEQFFTNNSHLNQDQIKQVVQAILNSDLTLSDFFKKLSSAGLSKQDAESLDLRVLEALVRNIVKYTPELKDPLTGSTNCSGFADLIYLWTKDQKTGKDKAVADDIGVVQLEIKGKPFGHVVIVGPDGMPIEATHVVEVINKKDGSVIGRKSLINDWADYEKVYGKGNVIFMAMGTDKTYIFSSAASEFKQQLWDGQQGHVVGFHPGAFYWTEMAVATQNSDERKNYIAMAERTIRFNEDSKTLVLDVYDGRIPLDMAKLILYSQLNDPSRAVRTLAALRTMKLDKDHLDPSLEMALSNPNVKSIDVQKENLLNSLRPVGPIFDENTVTGQLLGMERGLTTEIKGITQQLAEQGKQYKWTTDSSGRVTADITDPKLKESVEQRLTQLIGCLTWAATTQDKVNSLREAYKNGNPNVATEAQALLLRYNKRIIFTHVFDYGDSGNTGARDTAMNVLATEIYGHGSYYFWDFKNPQTGEIGAFVTPDRKYHSMATAYSHWLSNGKNISAETMDYVGAFMEWEKKYKSNAVVKTQYDLVRPRFVEVFKVADEHGLDGMLEVGYGKVGFSDELLANKPANRCLEVFKVNGPDGKPVVVGYGKIHLIEVLEANKPGQLYFHHTRGGGYVDESSKGEDVKPVSVEYLPVSVGYQRVGSVAESSIMNALDVTTPRDEALRQTAKTIGVLSGDYAAVLAPSRIEEMEGKAEKATSAISSDYMGALALYFTPSSSNVNGFNPASEQKFYSEYGKKTLAPYFAANDLNKQNPLIASAIETTMSTTNDVLRQFVMPAIEIRKQEFNTYAHGLLLGNQIWQEKALNAGVVLENLRKGGTVDIPSTMNILNDPELLINKAINSSMNKLLALWVIASVGGGIGLSGASLGIGAGMTRAGAFLARQPFAFFVNEAFYQASNLVATGQFGLGSSWKDQVFLAAAAAAEAGALGLLGREASVVASSRAGINTLKSLGALPAEVAATANEAQALISATKTLTMGARILNGLKNAGVGALTQAELWGRTGFRVGMVSGAVLKGEAPTFESMCSDYLSSAWKGALFGAGIGFVSGTLAVPGAAATAAATTADVAAAGRFSRSLQSVGRLAAAYPRITSSVAGAVLFPLGKTIVEGSGWQGLYDNYMTKAVWSNMARGAIIGFALGHGFSEGNGLFREGLRGVLRNPDVIQEVKMSKIFELGAKRFIYGAGTAFVAGTGVNYLRGDYGSRLHPNLTKIGWDSLGYGLVGGLTAIYISGNGKNIIKNLKLLGGEGKAQSTPAFFGLVNFAPAKGMTLLHDWAAAGAIDWTLVSPAFKLGGAFWDSLKVKYGYCGKYKTDEQYAGSEFNQDRYTKEAVRNISLLHPSTWVVEKGFAAPQGKEGAKPKMVLSTLTEGDLLQAAIEGPLSGLWMKPMISFFQTSTGRAPVLTEGGVGERLINVGRWSAKFYQASRALINGEEGWNFGRAFRAASVGSEELGIKGMREIINGSLASTDGFLTAARWVDSNIIYMPGFVTGIKFGIDLTDKLAMKLNKTNYAYVSADCNGVVCSKPQEGIIDGQKYNFYKRQGYLSEGMKEYTNWMLFFMMPGYAPAARIGDSITLQDGSKLTYTKLSADKQPVEARIKGTDGSIQRVAIAENGTITPYHEVGNIDTLKDGTKVRVESVHNGVREFGRRLSDNEWVVYGADNSISLMPTPEGERISLKDGKILQVTSYSQGKPVMGILDGQRVAISHGGDGSMKFTPHFQVSDLIPMQDGTNAEVTDARNGIAVLGTHNGQDVIFGKDNTVIPFTTSAQGLIKPAGVYEVGDILPLESGRQATISEVNRYNQPTMATIEGQNHIVTITEKGMSFTPQGVGFETGMAGSSLPEAPHVTSAKFLSNYELTVHRVGTSSFGVGGRGMNDGNGNVYITDNAAMLHEVAEALGSRDMGLSLDNRHLLGLGAELQAVGLSSDAQARIAVDAAEVLSKFGGGAMGRKAASDFVRNHPLVTEAMSRGLAREWQPLGEVLERPDLVGTRLPDLSRGFGFEQGVGTDTLSQPDIEKRLGKDFYVNEGLVGSDHALARLAKDAIAALTAREENAAELRLFGQAYMQQPSQEILKQFVAVADAYARTQENPAEALNQLRRDYLEQGRSVAPRDRSASARDLRQALNAHEKFLRGMQMFESSTSPEADAAALKQLERAANLSPSNIKIPYLWAASAAADNLAKYPRAGENGQVYREKEGKWTKAIEQEVEKRGGSGVIFLTIVKDITKRVFGKQVQESGEDDVGIARRRTALTMALSQLSGRAVNAIEAGQGLGKSTTFNLAFAVSCLKTGKPVTMLFPDDGLLKDGRNFYTGLDEKDGRNVLEVLRDHLPQLRGLNDKDAIAKLEEIFIHIKEDDLKNPDQLQLLLDRLQKGSNVAMLTYHTRMLLKGEAPTSELYRNIVAELSRRANLLEEGASITSLPSLTMAEQMRGFKDLPRIKGIIEAYVPVALRVICQISGAYAPEEIQGITLESYLKDPSVRGKILNALGALKHQVTTEYTIHGARRQVYNAPRFLVDGELPAGEHSFVLSFLSGVMGGKESFKTAAEAWAAVDKGYNDGGIRRQDLEYFLGTLADAINALKSGEVQNHVRLYDGAIVPYSESMFNSVHEGVRQHRALLNVLTEMLRNRDTVIDLDTIETGRSMALVAMQDIIRDIVEHNGTATIIGGGLNGVAEDLRMQFGAEVFLGRRLPQDQLSGLEGAEYSHIRADAAETAEASRVLSDAVQRYVGEGRSLTIALANKPLDSVVAVEPFGRMIWGEEGTRNTNTEIYYKDSADREWRLSFKDGKFRMDRNDTRPKDDSEKVNFESLHRDRPGSVLIIDGSTLGKNLKFSEETTKNKDAALITVADWSTPMVRIRQSYRLRFGSKNTDLIMLGVENATSLNEAQLKEGIVKSAWDSQERIKRQVAVERSLTGIFEINHHVIDRVAERVAMKYREGRITLAQAQAVQEQLEAVRKNWRESDEVYTGARRGVDSADKILQEALNHARDSFLRDTGKDTALYKVMSENRCGDIWGEEIGSRAEALNNPHALDLNLAGYGTGKPYYAVDSLIEMADSINTYNRFDVLSREYTSNIAGNRFHSVVGRSQVRPEVSETRPPAARNEIAETVKRDESSDVVSGIVDRLAVLSGATMKTAAGVVLTDEMRHLQDSLVTAPPNQLRDMKRRLAVLDLGAYNFSDLPEDRKLTPLEAYDIAARLVESGVVNLSDLRTRGLDSIMQLEVLSAPGLEAYAAKKLTLAEFHKFQIDVAASPQLAGTRLLIERLPQGTPARVLLERKIERQLPLWQDVLANQHPDMSNIKERQAYEQRWARLGSSTIGDMIEFTERVTGQPVVSLHNLVPYFGIFMPGLSYENKKKFLRQTELFLAHGVGPLVVAPVGVRSDGSPILHKGQFSESELSRLVPQALEFAKGITVGDLMMGRAHESFWTSLDLESKNLAGVGTDVKGALEKAQKIAQEQKRQYEKSLQQQGNGQVGKKKVGLQEINIPVYLGAGIRNQNQRFAFMMLAGGGYRTQDFLKDMEQAHAGLLDSFSAADKTPVQGFAKAYREALNMPAQVLLSGSLERYMGYIGDRVIPLTPSSKKIVRTESGRFRIEVSWSRAAHEAARKLTGQANPSFLSPAQLDRVLQYVVVAAGALDQDLQTKIMALNRFNNERETSSLSLQQQEEIANKMAALKSEISKKQQSLVDQLKPKVYGLFGLGANRMQRYEDAEAKQRSARFYDSGIKREEPVSDISAWDLASKSQTKRGELRFKFDKEVSAFYLNNVAAIKSPGDANGRAAAKTQKLQEVLGLSRTGDIRLAVKALRQAGVRGSVDVQEIAGISGVSRGVAAMLEDIDSVLRGDSGLSTKDIRFVNPMNVLLALEGTARSLDNLQRKVNHPGGIRETFLKEFFGVQTLEEARQRNLDNVALDFDIVHGKDMMKKGIAAAEATFDAATKTGHIRLRATALTPINRYRGKYPSYILYHEIPHEMTHVGLTVLNNRGSVDGAQAERLEGYFGEGFSDAFLGPADAQGLRAWKEDVSMGPDGTYNELLASVGGLRFVARHAPRRDSARLVPAQSLTGAGGLGFLTSIKYGQASFQETRAAIENHRPELRQVEIKTEKDMEEMQRSGALANESVLEVKGQLSGLTPVKRQEISELDVEKMIRSAFAAMGKTETFPDGLPLGITVAFLAHGEKLGEFENGSGEHRSRNDRMWKPGDMIRVDYGVQAKRGNIDRLNTDKTIVFAMSEDNQVSLVHRSDYHKLQRIIDNVRNGFKIIDPQTGRVEYQFQGLGPGLKMSELRTAIEMAYRHQGMGGFIPQSTAVLHGIGRSVHEVGQGLLLFMDRNQDHQNQDFTFQRGHTFALELSIGDLRLEDVYGITRNGYSILTDLQDRGLALEAGSGDFEGPDHPLDIKDLITWYNKSGLSSEDMSRGMRIGYAATDEKVRGVLVEEIVKSAAKSGNKTVLDVGMGSGIIAEALAKKGLVVTGTDINDELLVRARQKGITAIIKADDLTCFAKESFGSIVISEAIGHMISQDKKLADVLTEANRVLVPGGTIHVTHYTQDSPFLRDALYKVHSADEVLSVLKSAGFKNPQVVFKTDMQGYIYIRAEKPESTAATTQSVPASSSPLTTLKAVETPAVGTSFVAAAGSAGSPVGKGRPKPNKPPTAVGAPLWGAPPFLNENVDTGTEAFNLGEAKSRLEKPSEQRIEAEEQPARKAFDLGEARSRLEKPSEQRMSLYEPNLGLGTLLTPGYQNTSLPSSLISSFSLSSASSPVIPAKFLSPDDILYFYHGIPGMAKHYGIQEKILPATLSITLLDENLRVLETNYYKRPKDDVTADRHSSLAARAQELMVLRVGLEGDNDPRLQYVRDIANFMVKAKDTGFFMDLPSLTPRETTRLRIYPYTMLEQVYSQMYARMNPKRPLNRTEVLNIVQREGELLAQHTIANRLYGLFNLGQSLTSQAREQQFWDARTLIDKARRGEDFTYTANSNIDSFVEIEHFSVGESPKGLTSVAFPKNIVSVLDRDLISLIPTGEAKILPVTRLSISVSEDGELGLQTNVFYKENKIPLPPVPLSRVFTEYGIGLKGLLPFVDRGFLSQYRLKSWQTEDEATHGILSLIRNRPLIEVPLDVDQLSIPNSTLTLKDAFQEMVGQTKVRNSRGDVIIGQGHTHIQKGSSPVSATPTLASSSGTLQQPSNITSSPLAMPAPSPAASQPTASLAKVTAREAVRAVDDARRLMERLRSGLSAEKALEVIRQAEDVFSLALRY
jgi:Xaa-Pro aminopeptidase